MTLLEFFTSTKTSTLKLHRPRIICNDGFNMSVQGSNFNYSEPREDNAVYSSLEIGYPSDKEDLIIEYAESKSEPTNTVYGYVPCETIEKVIEKHGGINVAKTFK